MEFNIKDVPFSKRGSYFAISYLLEGSNYEEGLYIRNVRGGDDRISHLLKIDMVYEGKVIDYRIIEEPHKLTLESHYGSIYFSLEDNNTLRLKGSGVTLRLKGPKGYYDNIVNLGDYYELNAYSEGLRLGIVPLKGVMKVNAPWKIIRSEFISIDISGESFESAIEVYCTVKEERVRFKDFSKCVEDSEEDFNNWINKTLEGKKEYEKGRILASYITWSSVVHSRGMLDYDAMYMSKNWMNNIWSWDNCFNAMALIDNNPQVALEQLLIFFNKQDKSGMIPDFINDKYCYYNSTKPPIHGWAISYMMKRNPKFFSNEVISKLYEPLKNWTNWWFKYRDSDNDGVPEYTHGNDSGWDNSTAFHKGVPVELPDLSAFLILQLEVLIDFSERLKREEEREEFQNKIKNLESNILEHFWNGEKFQGCISGSHESTIGDSLILYVPLILGERLPKYIREKLIEGLKEEGRFLTKHGFLTEALNSQWYKDDGYWLGPIWAPSTMIMVEALKAVGEEELAINVSRAYCNMALKSGMAENFNGKTGEGLRDKAFTWTSSVFLILNNYLWIKGK